MHEIKSGRWKISNLTACLFYEKTNIRYSYDPLLDVLSSFSAPTIRGAPRASGSGCTPPARPMTGGGAGWEGLVSEGPPRVEVCLAHQRRALPEPRGAHRCRWYQETPTGWANHGELPASERYPSRRSGTWDWWIESFPTWSVDYPQYSHWPLSGLLRSHLRENHA